MDITSLRKDCGALRYLVCNVVFYYKNNSRYINIVMDQVLEVPWKNEQKASLKTFLKFPLFQILNQEIQKGKIKISVFDYLVFLNAYLKLQFLVPDTSLYRQQLYYKEKSRIGKKVHRHLANYISLRSIEYTLI